LSTETLPARLPVPPALPKLNPAEMLPAPPSTEIDRIDELLPPLPPSDWAKIP
jgi:hypothetical protein